jgi:hypothetical protein
MPEDSPNPSATNNGVYQTGGASHIGNQAVGHGAQAFSGSVSFRITDSAQRAQATELLSYVERLLDEYAAALPDVGATRTQIRRLREELGEAEPEPRVLQRTLERLTSFVQPVAPLVVAVSQLTQAVQGALKRW